jgi:hypothetical protein
MTRRERAITEIMDPQQLRIAALELENSQLRLQLYWGRRAPWQLETAVLSSDFAGVTRRCRCQPCCLSGVSREACAPWWEAAPVCETLKLVTTLAERFGLTVEARRDGSCMQHFDMTEGGVYDQDCHIVCAAAGGSNFFTYGARLWGAASADDPELKKLADLFDFLGQYQ